MPTPQDLSLTFYFTRGLLQQFAKKPLFGSPYVEVGALIGAQAQLFEMGAVLGRAKRDSLAEVLQLIADPAKTDTFYASLQRICNERLAAYGGEPDSFWDYITATEIPKFSRQSPATFFQSREAQQRTSSMNSINMTGLIMAEGIAFGSLHPELTHQMVAASLTTRAKTWPEAFRAGVLIPMHPDIESYEEYETGVLALLETYQAEFHY